MLKDGEVNCKAAEKAAEELVHRIACPYSCLLVESWIGHSLVMSVEACVYVCVYVYVCTYVCVFTCTCMCVLCAYLFSSTHMYPCVCVYTWQGLIQCQNLSQSSRSYAVIPVWLYRNLFYWPPFQSFPPNSCIPARRLKVERVGGRQRRSSANSCRRRVGQLRSGCCL